MSVMVSLEQSRSPQPKRHAAAAAADVGSAVEIGADAPTSLDLRQDWHLLSCSALTGPAADPGCEPNSNVSFICIRYSCGFVTFTTLSMDRMKHLLICSTILSATVSGMVFSSLLAMPVMLFVHLLV